MKYTDIRIYIERAPHFSLAYLISILGHSQKVKNQEFTKFPAISQYHITALTSGARGNSSKSNTHTPTQS